MLRPSLLRAVLGCLLAASSAAETRAQQADELRQKVAGLREAGRYVDALEAAHDLAEAARAESAWVLADARRLVETLAVVAAWDSAKQAELADTESLKTAMDAMAERGEFIRGLETAKRLHSTRSRLLGARHHETLAAQNIVGVFLMQTGDLAAAQEQLAATREAQLEVLGPNHPEVIQTSQNLAGVLRDSGQIQPAGTLMLDVAQRTSGLFGDEHPRTHEAQMALAVLREAQGDLPDAIRIAAPIVEAQRRLEAPAKILVTSLTNYGSFLTSAGRLDAARSSLEEAVERGSDELGAGHAATVLATNHLAVLEFSAGNYSAALERAEQAHVGFKALYGESDKRTLMARHNIAGAQKELGRLREAEEGLREVLRLRRQMLGDRAVDVVISIAGLAAILTATGKYDEAETLYAECIQTSEEVFGPEHFYTLYWTNTFGESLQAAEKLERAEPLFRRALTGLTKLLGSSHALTVTSLANLAMCRLYRGDPIEAEALLRQAIHAARVGSHRPNELTMQNNLAYMLSLRGRKAEAVRLLLEVASEREQLLGPDHVLTLSTRSSAAQLLASLGRRHEAETILRDVVKRFETSGQSSSDDALAATNNLVFVLARDGRISDAKGIVEDAFARASKHFGASHSTTLHLAANYAVALQDEGAEERARRMLEPSLAACEARFGGDHRLTMMMRISLAGVVASTDRERAVKLYEMSVETAERIRALAPGDERERMLLAESVDLRAMTSRLAAVLVDAGRPAAAFDAVERGRARALIDLFASRAVRASPRGQEAADDERRLVKEAFEAESRFSRAQSRRRAGESVPSAEIDELRAQLDRARSELAALRGGFTRRVSTSLPVGQPVRCVEVQRQLEPGELVLSWIWPEERVVLVVADALSVEGHVLTTTEDEARRLAADTSEYRSWIREPHGDDARRMLELGRSVAERAIPDAVRQRLLAGARVTVIADGPLRGLPLESLPVTVVSDAVDPCAEARFLVDTEASFRYADSASIWAGCRERSRRARAPRGTAVVVGDPLFVRDAEGEDDPAPDGDRVRSGDPAVASAVDQVRLYGGRLEPLPATRVEGQAVVELLRESGMEVETLLGKDATVTALEAAADGCSVLHIATHGLSGSLSRPFDSSLALTPPRSPSPADIGFLRLEELVGRWSGKLDRCRLVVLSACGARMTPRSDGGVLALPWGFLFAGSPRVVASMWHVKDERTADFMREFYRAWRNDRVAVADALQQAQRSIRRDHPHPFAWSSFVVVGDDLVRR